jgi:myo-inositol-1(or 4)-monophosphatase
MRVSEVGDMHAATVELGWSTRRPASAYVDMIGRLFAAGGAMRRAGSGALGLVDVAAGRVEAYAELHINSWDCAAGIVLVQEAGGRTNDFFEGDGLRSGNPLLATNAALCGKLADVIGIPI